MIVLYVSDSIILIPAMHVYVPWRFTCTTIIISIVMSMASVLRRVQIFSWSLTTSRQWSAQSWVLCRELISYITYADNPASFDACEVAKPSDQLPASVKTLVGGTCYNNFDTNPDVMYSHTADNAVDVPSIIEGFYGAGRLNHGDIHFDIPDETVVTSGHQQPLPALANILDSYESGVVKVMGVEWIMDWCILQNGQNQTYSGFLSVFCFLLAIFCLVLLIVFDTFATTTKC